MIASRLLGCLALGLTTVGCLGGSDGLPSLPGTEDDAPSTQADEPYDEGPVSSPTTAEQYAAARCAAMAECECEYQPFASTSDCERIVAASYRHLQFVVGEAELDVACWQSVLALLESAPCGLATDLVAEAAIPSCFTYRGDGAIGDECYQNPGVLTHADTCKPGLTCKNSLLGWRCFEATTEPTRGQPGTPCGTEDSIKAECGPALYCQPGTQVCQPRMAVGQACDASQGCVHGAWCSGDYLDGKGTCTEQTVVGESCSSSLACAPTACTDALCVDGLCAAAECIEPQPLVCLVGTV